MASVRRPVAVVFGTRPEIVKLAAVVRLLGDRGRVVYTGQHYDDALSGSLFRAMGIPAPHHCLSGVGGAVRGHQIGGMVSALTDLFAAEPPSAVIVQGDTNSTSAAAQAAHYHGAPVIHVEAGLRSRDRAMPEEINRQIVGVLADLHCAPTETAAVNLRSEGVPDERIRVTGNTIVEMVRASLPGARESRAMVRSHGLRPDAFVLATLHRPENTDDPSRLRVLLDQLARIGLPVLFPVHPRTLRCAQQHGLERQLRQLGAIDPVDHRWFLGLARHARLLVSDSGGVQEECTVLKKPLIVIRNSTERPEAVEAGFATLLAPGPQVSVVGQRMIADVSLGARLAALPSPYGDGHASERIVRLALRLADGHGRSRVQHVPAAHRSEDMAAGPSSSPYTHAHSAPVPAAASSPF